MTFVESMLLIAGKMPGPTTAICDRFGQWASFSVLQKMSLVELDGTSWSPFRFAYFDDHQQMKLSSWIYRLTDNDYFSFARECLHARGTSHIAHTQTYVIDQALGQVKPAGTAVIKKPATKSANKGASGGNAKSSSLNTILETKTPNAPPVSDRNRLTLRIDHIDDRGRAS